MMEQTSKSIKFKQAPSLGLNILFKASLVKYSFLFFWCLLPMIAHGASWPQRLFDYQEIVQPNMNYVGQWLTVLERHIIEDVPDGDCTESFFNRCHLKEWYAFLEEIKDLSPRQQINAVNQFANNKRYVLDINNYGVVDHWAIAREFLNNGGDCEDYAITKFFSLRWLGHDTTTLRLVVLQDTNLRIPHAVLAVLYDNDVLIMDNQSRKVISHRVIAHYVPLFSVSENYWWLHLPPK